MVFYLHKKSLTRDYFIIDSRDFLFVYRDGFLLRPFYVDDDFATSRRNVSFRIYTSGISSWRLEQVKVSKPTGTVDLGVLDIVSRSLIF